MRFNIKITGIALGGIIMFFAILTLLISLGIFNSSITRNLSRISGNHLNGTLTIAEMEGNPLSHFYFRGIHIMQNGEKIIFVDEIEIDYNPWKIVRKQLDLAHLSIDGIDILLIDEADSLWNLQKLILPSSPSITDTLASSFTWKVEMADLQISNLEVNIIPGDRSKAIPHFLKLDASLNFDYRDELMHIKLYEFKLITQEPFLQINHLAFQAALIDSVVTWNNFELRLPHSNINSKGSIPLQETHLSEVFIKATPLDLEDLVEWLPAIHGNPEINLQISNEDRFSKIDLSLIQDNQSIIVQGWLSDLQKTPSYRFLLDVDSLNGEYWIGNSEFQSNIKGELKLSGEGLNFRENSVNANAQFANLKYENYELKNFLLLFEKNSEMLKGSVKANTLFGEVNSEIQIKNIFDHPAYEAKVQMKHFNLAGLTSNKSLESSINIDFQAIGQGIIPGEMQAVVSLKSNNSVLFDQPVIDFNSKIILDREEYRIEGFRFETSYIQALISGKGNISDHNQLHFNIKAKNIEEIGRKLGLKPFRFEGEIDGSLSGPANSLGFTSSIQVLDFWTDSLVIRNLNSHITSHISFNQGFSDIKSFLSASKDSMLNPKKLYLKTDTEIEFASFGEYYIEETSFKILKDRESLEGRLMSNTLLGILDTQFKIGQIFSEPDYQITSSLRNLDLSRITKNEDLQSDLNLEIAIEGIGIKPESLRGQVEFRSNRSSIFGLPVEDIDAKVSIEEKNYLLERFHVETPFVFASLTGAGNWIENNKLVFTLKTKDSGIIPPLFGPKNLQFSADMKGEISGTADSLEFSSALNIENLDFDTIHVRQIIADANMQRTDKGHSGFLNVQINDSKIQDFKLSKVAFASNFNQVNATNSFSFFANDSLYGTILTDVYFSKKPTLFIPEIVLNYQGDLWRGGSNHSYLRFGEDSIEINDLSITTGESAVKASGIFAFRGSEDLHFEMKNFNPIRIPGIQFFPYPLSGNISSVLDITGTSEQPVLKGSIDIFEPKIDTLSFSRFHTTFNYANENFVMEAFLDDHTKRLLNSNLQFPLHFSFSDSIFLLRENSPINGNIVIDQLHLKRFNRFIPLKGVETNGLLAANITLSNTFDNPSVYGRLNLVNGTFTYPKLGVNYNNIEMRSRFDNKMFNLDSLQILSNNGSIKLKGSVEMESLFAGEINRIDLNLNGQNFKAFDSELLKAVINSNIDLNGTLANPVFSGNLKILRSTLNTDLFIKELNRVSNSDQPMLLMAHREDEDIEYHQISKKDTTRKAPPDIYKNLRGEFDIEIPRNTWVKGKNMNFELAGTIKAIKEGEQFDLFGSMKVRRGYYKIYGKKLDFEEGELTLTGGKLMDPAIDFLIAYKFRDPDQMLRKLSVKISGKASKPELKFYLDDLLIEEKDAISYLLFSKNTNQLDSRENSVVTKSNFDIAKDLTIGQLTNAVQDVIESSLGLDVIEISGNNGWTQGNVSVGKYISNNLFLNYERSFSLDKKSKIIEPQKISLEYQIYRSLFLQATNQSSNSGFDFIFNWTWK